MGPSAGLFKYNSENLSRNPSLDTSKELIKIKTDNLFQ